LRVAAWPAGTERLANPYSRLFADALRAQGCRVDELSWKRLLTERYDIAHVHWPEWVLDSGSFVQVTRMLTALQVARLRGMRLCWTVHNLENHERPRSLLGALGARNFVRQVDAVFCLTQGGIAAIHAEFPRLAETPTFVIPHGHYRGAYPDTIGCSEARAALGIADDAHVLATVGLLRPYKGIETLLDAFRGVADPDAMLLVAGRPVSEEYGRSLAAAASQDSRVHLRLGLVPADEMQQWMRATDVMVLPYTESFNSGAAWLALSFDRPVLAPALGSFVELRDEVGPRWVTTYDGKLTAATLEKALDDATATAPGRIELPASIWDEIGATAVRAYRSVLPASNRYR
jgi:beta-1,4-mannosyltransferase